MRPCCGSLIHAIGVLIDVDSSIWDSTWEDNFPTSLLNLGTITYDAPAAEGWLCHSQNLCDRIAWKSHARSCRRTICAMYSGPQRSPSWNHSYGTSPSIPRGNMTPCNTTEKSVATASHEVWNLVHPVFHLCPTISPVEFPNPASCQCDGFCHQVTIVCFCQKPFLSAH